MATYIQGLTDYVPQIQPFQPDYNFLGNVMQTRQNKYDQSYNQVNSLYNSLLNSPMLRDANIKRREELFKTIDQDIKKISGMDLSLQQNQDAAMKVFQPFYDDKDMVNDMVWTKNYQSQLGKAEGMKNCTDHDKCGGRYWEDGVKKLHYKAEEFRNMSAQDALNFGKPQYENYYDWQKDAIKLAKDANLNVTQDIDTGKWIVTKKNGELVEGGLYGLFKNTYGNDPRVSANYETKAYVNRKEFAKQNAAQFGSEDAAESHYIQDVMNRYNEAFSRRKEDAVQTQQNLSGTKNALLEKKETTGLIPSELSILENILNGKEENAQAIVKSLDNVHETVTNPYLTDPTAMRAKSDAAEAFLSQEMDFQGMAKTLSLKDAELSLKANPYAVATHSANLSLRNSQTMAGVNHAYSLQKMSAKLNMDMSLEEYKYSLKGGTLAKDESTTQVLTDKAYATAFDQDPTSTYRKQNLLESQLQASVKQKDTQFLYELLNHAKNNSNNNPGAEAYLKNFFGKNWSTIKSEEDMVKQLTLNKKSVEQAFDLSLAHLDSKKNPYGNVEWAKNFMIDRSTQIQDIKDETDTFYGMAAFNLTNNKKVASKIQAQAVPGQELYKDADLLLTPNGFFRDEETPPAEFRDRYIARHNPAVAKYGKQHPDYMKEVKASMAAYGTLKDKFYEEYNRTPGMSIEQGPGMSGSSGKTAYGVKYMDVNAGLAKGNGARAKSILKDVTGSSNYDIVIGEPTADNLKNAESYEALKPLLESIRSDMNTAHIKNKVGFFDFVETPIAANNDKKSAVTFRFDPEYLKRKIGDKTSPLYAYKDQLANGITMVYDNTQVNTATTRSTKMSTIEMQVKTIGKTYDSYDEAGKVKLTYNKSNGKYDMDWTSIEVNPETGKSYTTRHTESFTGDLALVDQNIKKILYTKQKENIAKQQDFTKRQQLANH